MDGLNRPALLDCLRKRRHYGTTGGPTGRMIIDLKARFEQEGQLYHDDPALFPSQPSHTNTALMGDIVHLTDGGVEFDAEIVAAAPIERIDLFNGLDLIETMRPFAESELGSRIRVIWEGAEYRGRFRQVVWDGTAQFSDASIREARPINFLNPDKTLEQVDAHSLRWQSLTTGNLGGFEVLLDDGAKGNLQLATPMVEFDIPLAEIGYEDRIFDNSGVLPRFIRAVRLPNDNPHTSFRFSRKIDIRPTGDNPIYIRVSLEDGTRAWTSPIYIYR
jgi:hypothetical protein